MITMTHVETFVEICTRVAAWNNARYEQVYNAELAANLLCEEAKELLDALAVNDQVEFLDGVADVMFVAVGCVWKQNGRIELDKLVEFNPEQDVMEVFGSLIEKTRMPTIYEINNACVCLLHSNGYTAEDYFEALLAVCDSNDTKAIKKTASNVKANVDKGAYFVPPTEALKRIVARRYE